MPCWYYEKEELKNTPTRKDEIDYETECRYREEGARFIMTAGTKMKLGYNTIATGVVYFHRFYMFHSFRNFPRYVTACSCLFLAGKVEETPKKCKDIIEVARSELDDFQFQQFGEDPKEEVMVLEKILLQTMKFDLQVDHPYQFLLKYAKCIKGDKKKLNGIVQMAWTFVNDSLRMTTLCLQWEPEVIAVALMYLAGKLGKFKVVDWFGRTEKHLFWWDMFVEGVTMKLLEDICHQVLDVYTKDQQNPSPAPATDSSPLSKINAYKKSKTLPIPTVVSPNTSQISPPPPVGKPITPFIGTVEVPGRDEALLLANENSSDSHYPYPPFYSNPPPGLPMFPAPFPAHPGSSKHPGPPVPPGPGVIPPMPPTSYPTSFSYPPPPFLYPPSGNTPPLKF